MVRFSFHRTIAGAALWFLMWSPARYAQVRDTVWADWQLAGPIEDLKSIDVLPINMPPTDQRLIATVRLLLVGSATFRQMVEVLKESRHVIVLLRSSSELRGQAPPFLRGRGRLSVGNGKIVGLFEIANGNAQERLAGVAHEIAHAVEVACLPAVHEEEDLRRLLLGQAGQPLSRSRVLPIETPFAQAAQRAVLNELIRHDEHSGQLVAIAARYGLSLPDNVPAEADDTT